MSAIKQNDKKINYYDYLNSLSNNDCNKALLRITPKIDMDKISNFIDEVLYISDIQKEFYKKYIGARYEKIILPAFEQIQRINQEEIPTLSM